ncbi:MAG: GntR family transcriptional regulator [Spirochaetales bacterium]|nr:GntR family transcriptional regulator [Spirochaetales bacterium]
MDTKKLKREPLYEQLSILLTELINSDEFVVGDKFLSERQICERFDVSRPTANKAVSALLQKQILEFRKGIGNFIINENSVDRHFHEHLSFTNKTLALGKKPTTNVVEFYKTSAGELPGYITKKIDADDDESITVVKRIRLADQKPVILECHYFRDKFFKENLTIDEVGVSVYDAITKNHGISLMRMDEFIRSCIISGENRSLFESEVDLPGFLMHFTPYTPENEALYFAEVLYRGDIFEFHNRIGPIQKSRPTVTTLSFK